ncbi:MAG: hypothetical protein KAH38_05840 [Candidatus Hydrogenedentes bacterium]|nr:hypothetical protein [Candidatus Hydrogenedentota bacterium]
MREYNFLIQPTGLKQRETDTVGHRSIVNLRVDKGHYTVPPAFTAQWAGTDRLFNGKNKVLLSRSNNKIYTVASDLALTEIGTGSTLRMAFQYADFGDNLVGTNGLYTFLLTGAVQSASQRLGAVTAYGTRLIYGDVTRLSYGDVITQQNLVGWSAIGGEDIPNILAGTVADDRILAWNEAGVAEMPWSGAVQVLKTIGDDIIVYGENGISVLKSNGKGFGIQAVKGLPNNIGVYGREAIDGDDTRHVFKGTDGQLWTISADLKAERLDYSWLLSGYDYITYDAEQENYWICSNLSGSYLLGEHGLGGPIDQMPKSIGIINNTKYITGTTYSEPITFELHSGDFNVSQNGQKRLTYVNLCGDFGNAQVQLSVKQGSNGTWRTLSSVRCSPDGAACVLANFDYGRVKISALCDPDSTLTRMEMRYQSHDRRFIRGTRAVGQTADSNT